MKKIKLTTPDYLPVMGGLTTYTLCLENILNKLKLDFDLIHWKKRSSIASVKCDNSIVINVNYLFGFLNKSKNVQNINFIHGSEILFYSQNIFLRILKRAFKSKILRYFEASHRNVFISEFTLEKLKSFGFKIDYSRDIVFHNCIDTIDSKYIENEIKTELLFCCIVRDVPHKNIKGTIELLEMIADYYPHNKVVLYLNSLKYESSKIEIRSEINFSDEKRERIYKTCHFNVLLSLDASKKGFFEGFGLTCLEAGKYGTPSIVSCYGGLPENVHHRKNGIVYIEDNDVFFKDIDYIIKNYESVRKYTFNHTCQSHSLEQLEIFLKKVIL